MGILYSKLVCNQCKLFGDMCENCTNLISENSNTSIMSDASELSITDTNIQ